MKKSIRRGSAGFTLIELMIVVAIVGVLATLAIFGIGKYVKTAKTAEAKNSVGAIGKAAAAAYETESMPGAILADGASSSNARSLCASATAAVPVDIGLIGNKKYQSTPAEWSADVATPKTGFSCLKYEMNDPQYYRYNYTAVGTSGDGATFAAVAQGDLDANGVLSSFTVNGEIRNQRLVVSPSIIEVNPEE